jgi:hypothetical protein
MLRDETKKTESSQNLDFSQYLDYYTQLLTTFVVAYNKMHVRVEHKFC